jgi:dimethylhistidine N-methyltransferase
MQHMAFSAPPHAPLRRSSFLTDVLYGLHSPRKHLPCKYLYDRRGSQLFDEICRLDEYYPTRTELAIMRRHGDEIAAALGPGCRVIEYGSGSSVKTRLLLDRLIEPAAYLPVDISRGHLLATTTRLARLYPQIPIHPICADFTMPFSLPSGAACGARDIVYFPGSTIGNFTPAEAVQLLADMAGLCGDGGGLLIGVDLKKPREILEAAYNDAQGVTRAFNLNLLARINRELGADFDLDRFAHRAVYNERHGRVEMHLESLCDQSVRIGSQVIPFRAGESIHTENSYKHTLQEFDDLAVEAGFEPECAWIDERQWFSVQYFRI